MKPNNNCKCWCIRCWPQHYGGAAERVIDVLLEGTLPQELAALDTQSAQLPPQLSGGPAEFQKGGIDSWPGLGGNGAGTLSAYL